MADTDAVLRRFRDEEDTYSFRISGSEDNFWSALDFLKDAIPSSLRSYDDETHRRTVLKTEEHEEALIRIFANGECCIRYVKSQLKLF